MLLLNREGCVDEVHKALDLSCIKKLVLGLLLVFWIMSNNFKNAENSL